MGHVRRDRSRIHYREGETIVSKIAFINQASAPRGIKGFFAWLRAKQPHIYGRVIPQFGEGALGDLGLSAPEVLATEKPVGSNVIDTIKDIVLGVSTAYLTAEQMRAQRKILDMQLKRAQAGLAPLDINPADYGASGPSVQVGVTSDTKQLLIYGGLVAIAAWVLFRRR